jgi:cytochrome c peroxidase
MKRTGFPLLVLTVCCAALAGCAKPVELGQTNRESPPDNPPGETEVPDDGLISPEAGSNLGGMLEAGSALVGAAGVPLEPELAPSSAPLESEPTLPSPPAEAAILPTKVTLGDPSLTAGISGEGPLTVEQIRTWLGMPGVLEPLEVSLPLGLSLGANQITGLTENPLTRAKIELGRQLYFDGRLSSDGTISCASCHDPQQGYAAHTQFGIGVGGQMGNRNSPVSFNRIVSGAQFWDGRAASLEEQAKGPIANPIEMANTHEAAIETISQIEGYRVQFDAVFGPDSINIDNVAKAIASFERTIVTGPAPYDYYAVLEPFLKQFPSEEDREALKEDAPEVYASYVQAKADSEAHPLSESAIRGKEIFFTDKGNCTACHVGANFTDEKYHNLGVGMDADSPDLGRFAVSQDEKDQGAFKTPTVRNVELTAPYMHDGSQKTLEEVIDWYAKGGHPNPHLSEKMKKLELTDQDKADLLAFLKSLTGAFPMVATGRLPE